MGGEKRKADQTGPPAKLRRVEGLHAGGVKHSPASSAASSSLHTHTPGLQSSSAADEPESELGPGGPVARQYALPADVTLPRLAVYEIMARRLPPGTAIEGEAVDMVRYAASRFLSLLAARAGQIADGGQQGKAGSAMGAGASTSTEGGRTLHASHVVAASSSLGYSGMARVLAVCAAPGQAKRVQEAMGQVVQGSVEGQGSGAGGIS